MKRKRSKRVITTNVDLVKEKGNRILKVGVFAYKWINAWKHLGLLRYWTWQLHESLHRISKHIHVNKHLFIKEIDTVIFAASPAMAKFFGTPFLRAFRFFRKTHTPANFLSFSNIGTGQEGSKSKENNWGKLHFIYQLD